MIRSMTGYGKAELQIPGYKFDLEIKSVNHRHCEITLQNLPQDLRYLELGIRKRVSGRFARGHFHLNFRLMPLTGEADESGFYLNEAVIEKCYKALTGIRGILGLKDEIGLEHLLVFRDQFFQKSPPADFRQIEQELELVLDRAMTQLESMRNEEGRALATDLSTHLELIRNRAGDLERNRETAVQSYKNRLLRKIEELNQDIEPDAQRIAQEVVLYSDRTDIQEELTRLRSHLDLFERMIQGNDPAGRGMDFLLQELNREINTISSKTGGTESTLFIKQELEILREQVQNVE